MALNLGDIKKKKGVSAEKATANPIDAPSTARMKVPFDLKSEQRAPEISKKLEVAATSAVEALSKAVVTSTNDQTTEVTPQTVSTESIALDIVAEPLRPSHVAPTLDMDNSETSHLKAAPELGINKAPIEHQLSIHKASIEHQKYSSDADIMPNTDNKASIEHPLSTDKAPAKQELSTNKALNPKITEKPAQLSTNKASIEHHGKPSKAGSKASIEHPLSINKAPTLKGSFTDLVGDEKSFIELIFAQLEHSLSMETNKIPTEQLATELRKTGNRVRTLIQRLVEKQVLIVAASARGKASWRRFSLPENVIQEIKLQRTIRHQLSSNWAGDKAGNKASEVPYSNSSLNKDSNTTITMDINFSERIEIPTDLTRTGIKLANIIPHVKTEEDLERINESLQAYAFDFHAKGIIKTAVFYGAIKSGQYYHSDAYTQEMEKERQKQAMAAKAREEANRIVPSFNSSSKKVAEEEFERDYSIELVKKVFKSLEKGDLDILQPMLDKGLEYKPFKETLKNKFLQMRMAELESDQGRG